MVLVFSTCNTVDLLLVKLHIVNKRRMVLVFSTCNTVDLLFGKLHLHDNNVNTEAKPRRYREILLYVPLNWAIPSYGLRPGGRYCPGHSPGNSKEHPTVLPDTSSASPRYCINVLLLVKLRSECKEILLSSLIKSFKIGHLVAFCALIKLSPRLDQYFGDFLTYKGL